MAQHVKSRGLELEGLGFLQDFGLTEQYVYGHQILR